VNSDAIYNDRALLAILPIIQRWKRAAGKPFLFARHQRTSQDKVLGVLQNQP
jgi:hypothetical protein